MLAQTAPPTSNLAAGNKATPRRVEWRLTTDTPAVGPGLPAIDTTGKTNYIKLLKVTVDVLGADGKPLDKCEINFSVPSSNQSTGWLPLDNPPKIGTTELRMSSTLDVVQVELRRPSKSYSASDPYLIYYNAIAPGDFTHDIHIVFQVS